MKRLLALSLVALATSVLAVGCSNEKKDDNKPSDDNSASSGTHVHADGTVHKNHGEDDGHSHDDGPHDGTIADWGGGAMHVEFTVDHDKKEAVVYILGDDAKSASPIDAKTILLSIEDPNFQVELTADPEEGETGGKCSRFRGTHDSLATVQEFKGTVSGVVDGTPYAGKFEEGEHEH